MTSFSRILVQSWKVKFHKVKLLKFCWNWWFFHNEKLWDLHCKPLQGNYRVELEHRDIPVVITGNGFAVQEKQPLKKRHQEKLAHDISLNSEELFLTQNVMIMMPPVLSSWSFGIFCYFPVSRMLLFGERRRTRSVSTVYRKTHSGLHNMSGLPLHIGKGIIIFFNKS